jgi:hypothetical protein
MPVRSIGPHEELPVGTKVRVGNKFGTVISASVKPAHPRGTIVVHEISFTEAVLRGVGRIRSKPKALTKPYTSFVNYSFIHVLE